MKDIKRDSNGKVIKFDASENKTVDLAKLRLKDKGKKSFMLKPGLYVLVEKSKCTEEFRKQYLKRMEDDAARH